MYTRSQLLYYSPVHVYRIPICHPSVRVDGRALPLRSCTAQVLRWRLTFPYWCLQYGYAYRT
jgi:hypothetical protein